MLKQVEEKLMEERDWGFRFYDVDCSLNHDLCKAAANIKGYPFVAIYNTQGKFESKIGGYYPIDVMRDIMKNISNSQAEALKKEKKVEKKAEPKKEASEEPAKVAD